MRGLEVFIMIFDDLTHPALYDSGFYVGEEDGHVLVLEEIPISEERRT